MSGRLIAIGDVHGCRPALDAMISLLEPTPADQIVMLGDYIDRGPDSKGVVESLLGLSGRTNLIALMGNHEEMMMDVVQGRESYHGWLRYGGVQTLESYGFDGNLQFLPDNHLEFYRNLGDFFQTDDYFFCHAAYDPGLELDAQPVEMLRWHSLRNGVPGRHQSGRVAIVGHTANHEGNLYDNGHLICLDTYCYGGGWLTAMELPSKRIWQVDRDGKQRVGTASSSFV